MGDISAHVRDATPQGEPARSYAGGALDRIAGSVSVVSTAPAPQRQRRLLYELGWLVGLFAIYNLGRILAAQNVRTAFDNAASVWSVERLLRLPDEHAIQAHLLQVWPTGVDFANGYYAVAHFPVTIGFLVWMLWRRPAYYTWVRRSLVLLTGAALVGHLLYPLAPPRMLPRLGMVDTGQLFGFSVYSGSPHTGVANQFAAMPSLHVAWAVLVAVGIVVSTRTRWRWLAVLHPGVTLFVVVVTANHYWLDGLVGVALLVVAMWLARTALPRRREGEPRS
ncbi:phosphatase PAP2 family protein [Solicola gregarius]|uniref:Phosphatase PAP2 family protein n=1 Tax=Solicola gregarius TaxID=2908642 RepID=A0AA46YJ44_9ACTN|nr:phosphatase PAP2 family protein [Solicola gregarius]UYM04065.1 phosphatase PAP2 family protein [Solicola gregarius]